jgi:hypothetical protein
MHEPTPATSNRPRFERLDCARRSACLGVVAVAVPPGVRDDLAPFLDCRACPAYAPERDPEQRAQDVAALVVLGTGAARGWRRVSIKGWEP